VRRDWGRRALTVLATGVALLASAASASAAGPPQIAASWVTDVTATGANLRAEINANGFSTTYRFEYIAEAAYQANLKAVPPREGFFGAAKAPAVKEAGVGSGTTFLAVVQHIGGLAPGTVYRYRPVATNSAGSVTGPEHLLTTQETSLVFELPDDRAWEMVSPVDKNGGAIAVPETLFGGGDFQAAVGGSAVTYGSATAFGGAAGAPPASQYISRRTTAGWITENVSAPLESAAYGDKPDGAPYRLFSTDLARGLLFGGLACRGGLAGCPAPNPVLPGTGAPPGYMAYYLRESATGLFASLLTGADLAHTAVEPEHFEVDFAAASPDLSHVVLSSCAALTADATEVILGPGECDPAAQNLYLHTGSGLALLNLLPGDTTGTPGAQVAAPIGAVSDDGTRIYWALGGDLFLRQGSQTIQVDEDVSGGGVFETASADGSVAFFTKEGHLHRFLAAGKATADLTPGGGVAGVLGASADGSHVYYQDSTALKQWHSGTTATVAPGATASAPTNHPPAAGTVRVSPDGEHLVFLSTAELTPFDNNGQSEVYLYGPLSGSGTPQLVCASCNPSGERPQGPSSIPGVLINGSIQAYKPRALTTAGTRIFFDSSDELVVHDTNSQPDVYQWEAAGTGDCDRAPGCVSLISSGRSLEGARFIDASAGGSDVYFTTDGSLVAADPGAIDLYDARVGGGFAEVQKPIPCVADACQSLPSPPDDPTPGTLQRSAGNPPPRILKERKKKRKQAKGKRRGQKKSRGKRGGRGGR
jgi:WD40-like Beta Propeller Repeat